MLGVSVGVAAVVAIFALGSGARLKIREETAMLGTNLIAISSRPNAKTGARQNTADISTLSLNDVKALSKQLTNLSAVSPVVHYSVQIIYENSNWETMLNGVNEHYWLIKDWTVETGRFLSREDIQSAAKVCVLGDTVVTEVFGEENPIGKTIRMGNVPIRVIGTLKPKGGEDYDDCVFAPYNMVMGRFTRQTKLTTVRCSAVSADVVPETKVQIEELLRELHRLKADDENNFMVITQAELQAFDDELVTTFTQMLAGIASVSLLVGGIGIMNIMLVSVTERIREIGIRMALGARMRDILWQFLAEAVALSFVGGAGGLLLAFVMVKVAEPAIDMSLPIEILPITLALGVSIVTGIFFGIYPAYKAAKLDPIEALHTE